jgi:KaiC/GvpD/RAD55 family RecA-like ATPase
MMIRKVSTGIEGLDPLIGGGIPEGFIVLVSGTTGSGKTTFLIHYIYKGLQDGEKCIFFTLEQTPEDIKKTASQYGMNLEKFEQEGTLKIIYFSPIEITMQDDPREFILKLIYEIKSFDPRRIAIN